MLLYRIRERYMYVVSTTAWHIPWALEVWFSEGGGDIILSHITVCIPTPRRPKNKVTKNRYKVVNIFHVLWYNMDLSNPLCVFYSFAKARGENTQPVG
jgi:hypothetical protein